MKSYYKTGGYDHRKADYKRYAIKRKFTVMDHYSDGKLECANCGIKGLEFLTIDHIDGKGKQHRKKIKKMGDNFYKWLIKNDYPKPYQVLCWNCNHAKHLQILNKNTNTPPFPKKRFNAILADPSWNYNDKASAGQRGASFKYKTMTLEDISNLPIHEISKKNCILFLWATPPMIKEALIVMRHWGFNYKTFGFVWIKKSKKGTNKIGMGSWTRANAEIVLIGTKGKPKRKNAGIRQIIESIPREHSRKPDEIYNQIEQLIGNVSRIELFARFKRKGWASWGLEIKRRNKFQK